MPSVMHNRAPPEPFLVQYLCEEISPPVVLDHQGADDEKVEDKDIGDEELWIASKWVDLT